MLNGKQQVADEHVRSDRCVRKNAGTQERAVRTRMRDECGGPAGHSRPPASRRRQGQRAVGAGAFQEAEHMALSFETHRRTTEKHHILRKATNGLCLGLASCEKAAASGPRENP